VDETEMREVVAAAPVGRLATLDGNGRIHLVPFCFALAGDTLWSVVDVKPKSTTALKRLDNIHGHPDVTVLVDHYDDDWSRLWWVRLRGTARVHDHHDAAVDRLAAKYEQYRAARPMGAVIEIHISEWKGWSAR
jgi:PPOX class probable F420-dependent enzyme